MVLLIVLVMAYPLALIGLAVDVVANVVIAPVIFFDAPKEWLVTQRISCYIATGDHCK